MPYRRLPNTDKARLRALETACQKGRKTVPLRLPFSTKLLNRTEKTYREFLQIMEDKKKSYKERIAVNKDFQEQQHKTKLYISHFIQVLNMCILRGEMDKKERKLFGLDKDSTSTPEIHSIKDIIKWGKKVIEGNQESDMQGGIKIYNPKPAIVKIEFKKFLDLYNEKQIKNTIHEENSQKIKNLRKETDLLIAELWDSIEAYYKNGDDYGARKRCEAWGVVYVNRKKEKMIKNML